MKYIFSLAAFIFVLTNIAYADTPLNVRLYCPQTVVCNTTGPCYYSGEDKHWRAVKADPGGYSFTADDGAQAYSTHEDGLGWIALCTYGGHGDNKNQVELQHDFGSYQIQADTTAGNWQGPPPPNKNFFCQADPETNKTCPFKPAKTDA